MKQYESQLVQNRKSRAAMNEKKLKEQREMRKGIRYSMAKSLREVFPNVDKLFVDVELSFSSDVGIDAKKEFHKILEGTDLFYLHFDCLNVDCTGDGFDLENIAIMAIRSRSVQSGILKCAGKEDWKYLKSSGCSCQSYLKYVVRPQFLHSEDTD